MLNCFDVWVPYKLSEKNLESISRCNSLLKSNKNGPFLKQIVMSDETEEIVGPAKWTTANQTEGWSSSNEDAVVYTVGLEGNPLLWTPSEKPNN